DVDAPHDLGAAPVSRLWLRHHAAAVSEEPQDPGLPAGTRGSGDPVRRQPRAHATSSGIGPVRVSEPYADRARRRLDLSAHRPVAVPAHPVAFRLLLVCPGRGNQLADAAHAGPRTDAGLPDLR